MIASFFGYLKDLIWRNDNLDWIEDLQELCDEQNMEIDSIPLVIDNPKVMPMVRGHAFEFALTRLLETSLPKQYKVSNPYMNAQLGLHDIDVKIEEVKTGGKWSAECKLSSKGSFKYRKHPTLGKIPSFQVKCMRSRTYTEKKAKEVAPKIGVDWKELVVHNDQYRSADFDIVASSLANAFYITDDDGHFAYSPGDIDKGKGKEYLDHFGINQKQCFETVVFARSEDIIPKNTPDFSCRRKVCYDPDCGFVPNYPTVWLKEDRLGVEPPWVLIDELPALLEAGP